MPEEGFPCTPKEEHLTTEEFGRLIGVAASLGMTKVRLTGGEPLLRKDLSEIVRSAREAGVRDLSATTNGHRLAELAGDLFSAGLNRINVSLDTLRPDRFVYGLPSDPAAASTARGLLDEVYAVALAADTPLIATDYETAELVKVSANAFLATKISFINAMAEVCEAAGADVVQLADAIGYDARIGRKFLNSGVGFGGGCLPKDIRAFMARADELGAGEALGFLGEVDRVNLRRRDSAVALAADLLGGSVAGKRITVLGLSFKPDSDDVRDSPALSIACLLADAGADVVCHDPQAIENARKRFPELTYEPDLPAAVAGADAVMVLTEWKNYRELDPASLPGTSIIIDGRNCLDPERWRRAGWRYRALGRPREAQTVS